MLPYLETWYLISRELIQISGESVTDRLPNRLNLVVLLSRLDTNPDFEPLSFVLSVRAVNLSLAMVG